MINRKLIIVKEKGGDKEKFKIKCFENSEHNANNLDENEENDSVNDDVYNHSYLNDNNELQEYTQKKSVSILNCFHLLQIVFINNVKPKLTTLIETCFFSSYNIFC